MVGELLASGTTAGLVVGSAWAVTRVGTFLATTFPRTTGVLDAIAAEKLGTFLLERQKERELRLSKKVAEQAAERGIDGPTRHAPASLLHPLIEAGSLEDDDDLQDMWAKMIVNAIDAESSVEVRRAYASILQDCTRIDVQILAKLYNVEPSLRGSSFNTAYLPGRVMHYQEAGELGFLPPDNILRSLWNLQRLGLISAETVAGGDKRMHYVSITALGMGLVEACTMGERLTASDNQPAG